MKILPVILLLPVFLLSCGNNKAKIELRDAVTQIAGSALPDINSINASCMKDKEYSSTLEGDELFDDFIFNYAADNTLQLVRTKFPLPYIKNGVQTSIKKEIWEYNELFPGQNYYTLLFDNEKDMDIAGDTALTSVRLQWFFLKERKLKNYFFERMKGIWMLKSMELQDFGNEYDKGFISFYSRFVNDSIFQRSHIYLPLRFVTLDPDDEFSILETTLDLDQWYVFRPAMPSEWLSNICYGQSYDDRSNIKILKVNGIGNGYSNVFYFRRRFGTWELYKFEDTSI